MEDQLVSDETFLENDLEQTEQLRMSRLALYFRHHPELSQRVGIAVGAVGLVFMYAGIVDGGFVEKSKEITDAELAGGLSVSAVGLWIMTVGAFGMRKRNHEVGSETEDQNQE